MSEERKLSILLADEEARHAETREKLARAQSECVRLKANQRPVFDQSQCRCSFDAGGIRACDYCMEEGPFRA